MVINPQGSTMESSPLPDITTLCSQFENLSLMSSQYSSPSPATRNAMLAVDTEEVAMLEASLHPTTEPPPAFPEEPDYTPPTDTPPSFETRRIPTPITIAIQRTWTKPSPQPRTTAHSPTHQHTPPRQPRRPAKPRPRS